MLADESSPAADLPPPTARTMRGARPDRTPQGLAAWQRLPGSAGGDSAEAARQALAPTEVLRIGWAHRRSLAAATLATALAAVGLALLSEPRFETSASVLLDASARGGLFGNLNMLTPITGTAVATGEVAVLRSRSVVNAVVRPPRVDADERGPDERPDERDGDPTAALADLSARHLGLTTRVADRSRSVLSIVRAGFSGTADGRPIVQPAYRLRATLELTTADAPSVVGVEFVAADRVRLSTPSLAQRLGWGSDEAAELPFTPGETLAYRGSELVLEPVGDVVGRSFSVAAVPAHEAAEGLLERFWAAETVRNSGVIRVMVEDADPFRAAEIANALVTNYLAIQRDRRGRRSQATIGYIEQMLDDSRDAMEASQAEITRIRTERPEAIDLDATSEALVEELAALARQITGLELRERALNDVRAELAEGDTLALARLDSALTGGLFVDPITESYLERIGSLNAKSIELSQGLQDDHPRLVDLRATTAELMALIESQLASRVAGIVFQREALELEREERLADLMRLPAGMQAVAQTMLEYHTHKELLPELLKNLKATEIAESSTDFVAQFLDRAEPATRMSAPNLPALGAVGGLLGLLLGLFWAVVRDPFHGRLRERADLEATLRRPALGRVPLGDNALGNDSAPETAAAVRSLRAAIKNLDRPHRRARVLGWTALVPGPCGPRLAAALGRALAREGSSTVLVEADLEHRPLSFAFGLDAVSGLAATLRGDLPDLQAQRDDSGLVLIHAGAPCSIGGSDADSDRLGGPALDALLERLARTHDYVLVALPAADSAAVEAVAPKLDGVLVACEENRSRRHELRDACSRIERAGGVVLGTVLVGATSGRGPALARGPLPPASLEGSTREARRA